MIATQFRREVEVAVDRDAQYRRRNLTGHLPK
jgi:hypothetical protein